MLQHVPLCLLSSSTSHTTLKKERPTGWCSAITCETYHHHKQQTTTTTTVVVTNTTLSSSSTTENTSSSSSSAVLTSDDSHTMTVVPLTPEERLNVQPQTKIGINVSYHVLYDPNDTRTNVSIDQIKAQHVINNQIYAGDNADELVLLPTSYKHMGKANVVFFPESDDNLIDNSVVFRYASDPGKAFSGVLEVQKYMSQTLGLVSSEVVVPRHLNVYIVTLSGNKLGEAVIGGNVLAIDASTVGSPVQPGYGHDAYNKGKTMAHEAGHTLGLKHTFSGTESSCALPREVPDIPRQWQPNDNAVIFHDTKTQTNIAILDNRQRDCNIPTLDKATPSPYSCANFLSSEEFSCGKGPSETFWSLMDYARDEYLLMLSQGQVNLVRERLLGVDNNDLDIFLTSEGHEVNVSPDKIESEKSQTYSDFDVHLSTTITISVIIVMVAVIGGAVAYIVRRRHHSQSQNGNVSS
jgi:hypothetical protein